MKPGLWISPGKHLAGRVVIADIGIPDEATGTSDIGLLTASVVDGLPERGSADDKFSAGAVTVVGGSPGLTGAPLLASIGAARTGAGYVTAALPSGLISAADSVLEVMGLGLEDQDQCHCASGVSRILERLGPGRAVVVGPGIGRSPQASAAIKQLLAEASGPVVVDADALQAFAGQPERLASAVADLVLTPHAGEMAALLDCSSEEVAKHRLRAVRDLAMRASAVVVLKGDDTLVCSADGVVAVSPGGAPALATAGTGDVLSGVIGALLAKGVERFQAAAAAVLLHLEAGQIAGLAGAEGVLAGDVAACLPAARRRLQSGGR
jgi:NAD(P)H-hydrate epimerase